MQMIACQILLPTDLRRIILQQVTIREGIAPSIDWLIDCACNSSSILASMPARTCCAFRLVPSCFLVFPSRIYVKDYRTRSCSISGKIAPCCAISQGKALDWGTWYTRNRYSFHTNGGEFSCHGPNWLCKSAGPFSGQVRGSWFVFPGAGD